ncbi:hypothetical protein XF_1613 [Xylella fastidiosa 9a5c]|uniref:Uncharacterized protein n=1 Tax=Xylella fastidiosa (strain 9a5c) TaxID=160492 RepID=Q9PCZ1_XYLFA|nr:hypothetical protein XF_1613 [Xylella fastidiosa 9a5c]
MILRSEIFVISYFFNSHKNFKLSLFVILGIENISFGQSHVGPSVIRKSLIARVNRGWHD